ncbi:hypothetical protein D3C76_1349900 [compost metagenome]
MDFVSLQVPIPQPQFTGLERQGQTRLTLAQGLAGDLQFKTALRYPRLQAHLGRPQFFLGRTTLLDLPGQRVVELGAAGLRLLQVLDQRLVLEASQQTALDQAVDLPGHHAQRDQHNQPKPAPPALLLIAAPEEIADGR